MVVVLKCSRKVWSIGVVSRRIWGEVAAWRTGVSGLKGWSATAGRSGFRLTSPWIGVALCLSVEPTTGR